MLLVAKPVTWTLDPTRSRKTGSRYNDILSFAGKPKGSVTMSQNSCVIPMLTKRFSAKTALGVILPPSRCQIGVKQFIHVKQEVDIMIHSGVCYNVRKKLLSHSISY